MSGMKYKVAHRRPHWRAWSSEYPGQETDTERVVGILESTLDRLRSSRGRSAPLSLVLP